MEWFKHDSDATMDSKIKKLIIRYGVTGYGIYFHCLELIADSVSKDNLTFELEHDAEIIADDLRIQGSNDKSGREIVEEIMRYMIELNLFEESEGRIFCFKMLKRIDTSMTSNPKFRAMINNAKTRHDAVMMPSCKNRIDKIRLEEKRKEENIQEEEPAYIKDVPNKVEVQQLVSDCFTLISEHNTSGKHKIPVSKALMYFTQKEGRDILYLKNQGYSVDEIRSALKNYLKVADSDTWKSMFSFNAFCKNISEYVGEYFDMSKYVNAPKNDEEIQAISQKFLDANLETPDFYRFYATIAHNRKKWVMAGQPDGEELEKWASAALEEDVKAGRVDANGYYI